MALKLTNMKIKTESTGLVSEEGSRLNYGYGLSIYLNDAQLKKLGLTKPLPAGTIVTLEAKGIVESTSERVERKADDDADVVDVSMDVQITDLALEPEGTATNPAEILYKDS